jgi:uncharacterized lipoprotein YmbA
MKHLLLTTIAAVLLVGCGNPEADRALLDAANKIRSFWCVLITDVYGL